MKVSKHNNFPAGQDHRQWKKPWPKWALWYQKERTFKNL